MALRANQRSKSNWSKSNSGIIKSNKANPAKTRYTRASKGSALFIKFTKNHTKTKEFV